MSNEEGKRTTEKKNSTSCSENCQPSFFTLKSYYFLFFAAIGSSIPYLALYFRQLGLNASQTGSILGLRLSTELVGSPVWGMIGDRFKMRKFILLASLASFTTGTLLFLTVEPKNQQCIKVTPNETKIEPLIFTAGEIHLGPGVVQHNFESNESLLNENRSSLFIRINDSQELKKMFSIFLTIMFLGQIIGSVVFTMPDAILVGGLGQNVNSFGSIRQWGEVGVSIGSFTVGGVTNFYQSQVCGLLVKNYFVSFYFFAGFIAAAIFSASFIKVTYPEEGGAPKNPCYFSLIKKLLETRNFVVVLCACFFGVLIGFHETFGIWYLDDLGAKPYMIGIATGLRYAASFIGYLTAGALIHLFGVECLIAACLLLYTVLFLALSFVHGVWLGVALFSVQGFLYGFSFSSCVVFGGRISQDAGFYAAVQGKQSGLLLKFVLLAK